MKMNKLFAWDEVSEEVAEREPADLWFCNAEGGWDSQGFLFGPEDGDEMPPAGWEHGEPVIEVRDCGRFVALETWAPNKEEAIRRFRWHEAFRRVEQELKEAEQE